MDDKLRSEPRYSIVDKYDNVICQSHILDWAELIKGVLNSHAAMEVAIRVPAPEPRTLRAALEYTNVLLAKLPPSDEITYRINANKAVLNETKN